MPFTCARYTRMVSELENAPTGYRYEVGLMAAQRLAFDKENVVAFASGTIWGGLGRAALACVTGR